MPNLLSYGRIAVTIAIYFVVLLVHDDALFVTLVLAAVITDLLDGPLARRYGVASKAGANLDSLSDYVFYLSLLVWAAILQPAFMERIWPLAAVFALVYSAVLLASTMMRGVVGYHNRYTRFAATMGVVVALWISVLGPSVLAVAVLVAALLLDLGQRVWRLGRHLRGAVRS